MVKDVLVTVFIPVYNAENYIRECIDSILAQTYSIFEVLVIDDGSTDGSMAVVASYGDPRIRVYKNDRNRGIPYTRNRGLELAQGKYIALMDADDVAVPGRLAACVAYLEAHPEARVVGGLLDPVIHGQKKKGGRQMQKASCQNYSALFRSPLANSSAMIDLEFVRSHGIRYDESCFVAQDYDFFVQCLSHTQIVRLGKRLGWYRTGHDNITAVSRREKQQQRQQVIKGIRKKAFVNLGVTIAEEDFDYLWDQLSEGRPVTTEAEYCRTLEILKEIAGQIPAEGRTDFIQSVQRICVGMINGMAAGFSRKWAYWKKTKELCGSAYDLVACLRFLKGN